MLGKKKRKNKKLVSEAFGKKLDAQSNALHKIFFFFFFFFFLVYSFGPTFFFFLNFVAKSIILFWQLKQKAQDEPITRMAYPISHSFACGFLSQIFFFFFLFFLWLITFLNLVTKEIFAFFHLIAFLQVGFLLIIFSIHLPRHPKTKTMQ